MRIAVAGATGVGRHVAAVGRSRGHEVVELARRVSRARVLREQAGDRAWTMLADPEGNEFCAFVA